MSTKDTISIFQVVILGLLRLMCLLGFHSVLILMLNKV